MAVTPAHGNTAVAAGAALAAKNAAASATVLE
jgi:hypothetical protein